MNQQRWLCFNALLATACALVVSRCAHATGVPVAGFLPMVGIGLTDEFKDENDGELFFFAAAEPSYTGVPLGTGGNPHFDLAILDIGAAASLLTTTSDAAFNIQANGFRGTETLRIGGATGFLDTIINDPLAMFVTGFGNRTATAPLGLNTATMKGQSSISMLTMPPESDLPNIVGIPFVAQYATYVRSDQPQIFQHNGKTVRTPQIEFNELGSGGQGITRRAPFTLNSANGFLQPPIYIFNFENALSGLPLTDNPQAPTVLQEPGAMFLNVNVQNAGQSLNNFEFFFDTGADITVVSELNAVRLGFDPVLDEPEFTATVVGSGGMSQEVPGFFVDSFTIQAIGGSVTATNVPVIVLDVTDPSNPGNVVDGIVGTNLLAGRNVVIDPKPSTGGGGVGPSLYIGNPVTAQKDWTSTAASGNWNTSGNWSGNSAPDTLGIANVRHVTGGHQMAVLAADTTVWELNVSGGSTAQTMTVAVQSGAQLTTFSGINIEQGGVMELQNAALDTSYLEIFGGTLRGSGTILTGNGPIPGQVENRGGTVAPGTGVGTLNIGGRFVNSSTGTIAFDLGGTTAGTQYDQIHVTGAAAIEGTLAVSLADLGGGMFTPSAGNSFTLITATDGVGGMFDTLHLPGGFNWNVAYGTNNVVLSVVGLGIAGDYNQNGVVDAADFVAWRDQLGQSVTLPNDSTPGMVTQDDYIVWRGNFGKMSTGSGSATITVAGVPESGSLLLAMISVCGLALSRQRQR